MPARATRLFVLIARKANRAVIFRRGPSKQVALIAWDLERDRFEVGHWLKGRIYEQRCDLSPSGELLAYFAADWRAGGPGSWTAVSKPPYLTALLMWPKGDAWGGGALFETEHRIALNHGAHEQALADGYRLPRTVRVVTPDEHAGRGEDGPIQQQRELRDGWQLVREGTASAPRWDAVLTWSVDGHLMEKPMPARRSEPRVVLQRSLRGVHERDGPWYVYEHQLRSTSSDAIVSLGRTDWADWDHGGDLLFARAGRLYRLASDAARRLDLDAARELVDLRPLRFEAKAPPASATRW